MPQETHREKSRRIRAQIRELLTETKWSKRQIAKAVPCHLSTVYEVAREAGKKTDPALLVPANKQSLHHEDQEYVTTRWLADALDLEVGTISERLKNQDIATQARIRDTTFRTPIKFFRLDRIWELNDDWQKHYQHQQQISVPGQPDEREGLADLTDGEFDLLRSLIGWWLEKYFWPSSADLISLPAMKQHFSRIDEVRHQLRKLQKKGCLTRIHDLQTSRGRRSVQNQYRIHRGPKSLTGFIVHCGHCHKPHRVLWPWYQPIVQR